MTDVSMGACLPRGTCMEPLVTLVVDIYHEIRCKMVDARETYVRISSRGRCGPPARPRTAIECRLPAPRAFFVHCTYTCYNLQRRYAARRSPVSTSAPSLTPQLARLVRRLTCEVHLPGVLHAPRGFLARTSRPSGRGGGARRLLRHHGGDARGTRGPRARFRRRTRSGPPSENGAGHRRTNKHKKTKIGSVCGDAWINGK